MFVEPAVINRAPGNLELIRAFVNTWNIEHGQEALLGPAQIQAWLAAHQLMAEDEPVSQGDFEEIIRFREALRALLVLNNDGPLEAGTMETLNQLSQKLCLRVEFEAAEAVHLASVERGVAGAMGQLLGIVFTAMIDGSWSRLKACHNHGCRWAFYDLSKNRSATWCATTICGSRLKARAYRRRQRAVRAE
ncbi:MAG: CGNR zinc finger domain-containing protein [Anaerolineae bacterium]